MIAAGSAGDFIALGDTEPVEFMLYLYFGKTEDDLKNFALRDLGIIRTNKNANLSARFTDEAEARACFHYSRLLGQLETNSEEVYRSACRFTLIAETGRVRHFRALPETRLFSRHPNWDWRPIFVHLKWD
jgi:hypothetical protein